MVTVARRSPRRSDLAGNDRELVQGNSTLAGCSGIRRLTTPLA
jgi:hypothetical protein